VIPEAFLTADALCEAMYRWICGFRVFPDEAKKRLKTYEHYFISEGYMMEETLKGGSRQDIHETLRKKAVAGKLKSTGAAGKLSY
jgi:adenylosuccinate lyase